VRHTGFVAAQPAAEPLAALAAIRTMVTPLFRLVTARSAGADDSQKNISANTLGSLSTALAGGNSTGCVQQLQYGSSAVLAGGESTQ